MYLKHKQGTSHATFGAVKDPSVSIFQGQHSGSQQVCKTTQCRIAKGPSFRPLHAVATSSWAMTSVRYSYSYALLRVIS